MPAVELADVHAEREGPAVKCPEGAAVNGPEGAQGGLQALKQRLDQGARGDRGVWGAGVAQVDLRKKQMGDQGVRVALGVSEGVQGGLQNMC